MTMSQKKAATPESPPTFPCDEDDRTECNGSWIYFAGGDHQSCKTKPENCIYINKSGAVMPPYPQYPGEIVARAVAKANEEKAAQSALVGEADQGPHAEAEEEKAEA